MLAEQLPFHLCHPWETKHSQAISHYQVMPHRLLAGQIMRSVVLLILLLHAFPAKRGKVRLYLRLQCRDSILKIFMLSASIMHAGGR